MTRWKAPGRTGRARTTTAALVAAACLGVAASPVSAAAPALAWSDVFGTRTASEMVLAVAAGSDGTVAVVGRTTGTLPGLKSKGGTDAFVRLYELDGTVRWTRQVGTAGSDRATGVAIGPGGGIVVVGQVDGRLPGQRGAGDLDAFVQRWSSGGRLSWTRQLGTVARDWATAVTVDTAGEITLVGVTEGSFARFVNAGERDAFMRRYSPAGMVRWTRQFGSRRDDTAGGVTTDTAGGAVMVGTTWGSIAGMRPLGGADVFIRAYSAAGAIRWTRRIGTADGDLGAGIAAGPDGGTYVAGTTAGTFRGQTAAGGDDAFLARLGATGSVAWILQLGTPVHDQANAVAADDAGAARLAGETDGDLAAVGALGMTDGFVLAVEPDGSVRWGARMGTARVDLAMGVAVDARGGTVAGGSQNGYAPGSGNAFVRRYLPES